MIKFATMCYAPNLLGSRFLKNSQRFETEFPLIFLTDSEESFEGVTQINKKTGFKLIPKIGPFEHSIGNCGPKDFYGSWAFVYAIKTAQDLGLDYFLYMEEDCRVCLDYWDKLILSDFLKWPTEAKFGGTPVFWHPWAAKHRFSKKVIDYAYLYQKESGLPMALEGTGGLTEQMSFYPNGAIAIYSVSECVEYFEPLLSKLGQGLTPIAKAVEVSKLGSFDTHVGRCFLRKYGDRAFDKLAFLPSTYSGYMDTHVPLEDRLAMLNYKTKCAVHQVKGDEYV